MKAIFFDLYETLVTHLEPDWRPPPRSIAQRLGLDDQVFAAHWSQFDAAWQCGEIPSYEAALTGLCERYGGSPDQRVLAELSREYRSRATRAFEQIDPEIISIVATLREHGFRLGVITDSSDLDTAPWIESEFAPYFDDLVASHEIGSLKREQKTFSIACQRLDVHPSDAIFVGDGGGNELDSARRSGLETYWCTWFLDRWPEGRRPGSFPGDDWRQYEPQGTPPFTRLRRPRHLLARML